MVTARTRHAAADRLGEAFETERRRLARRIRDLRHARELSQEAAAELCGLHPVSLARIESGVKDVRLSTLVAISTAYAIPLDALFDDAAVTRTKARR